MKPPHRIVPREFRLASLPLTHCERFFAGSKIHGLVQEPSRNAARELEGVRGTGEQQRWMEAQESALAVILWQEARATRAKLREWNPRTMGRSVLH